MVRTLPAMQETQVRSLAWEDSLEKEMAICSSIIAWKNPMDREACQGGAGGGLQSMGSQESDMT